jgi:hypothetical protein
VRKFISDKKNLYLLFKKTAQEKFLPKFGIYNKIDADTLTQQIKKEIASTFFIIKPSNEIKSHGICMIKSDSLAQTLSTILNRKIVNTKSGDQLNYWKNNKDKDLIVMEYVPSNEILYRNEWYDPTLRISFILYHTKNSTGVILQNCFWRLPPKHLYSKGSLTQQHITKPDSDKSLSGIYVDPKTIGLLNKVLPPVLKQLYEGVLHLGTC